MEENKKNEGIKMSEKNNTNETDKVGEDIKRYEFIRDVDKNLWTYGSPVIFEKCILERDTISSKNRLTLKFTNIYEDNIKDMNVTVIASDNENNMQEISYSYKALGLKYLSSKGLDVKFKIENDNASHFEIKVDSIVFENGYIWKKQDAVYESTGEIDDLEFFAQAKNKDYQDNYVSAREAVSKEDTVNMANGIEILKRIEWYKDSDELLKNAQMKFNVIKKNEERQEARAHKKNKRKSTIKKRYIRAAVITGVIVVVTGLAALAFFVPNNKYTEAKSFLNKKEYTKAAKEFKELKGFLKSKGYLAEAYYNLGLNELSNDNENNASDYFKKSNDADDDSQYGIMAGSFLDYYSGVEALNNKDYDSAMKFFKSSADAASDFNLINKAGAGMAQIYYLQQKYDTAWNTIKNVYAKDKSYEKQYGEYGYGYAKHLVDGGKTKEGLAIYNTISKFAQGENLNGSVYNQAVKLAEQGKIQESMNLLNTIKKTYNKANKLYEEMYKFNGRVKYWIGLWKHKGEVKGKKVTYRIRISSVLYKGDMCLRIIDKNNKLLGFDTVISSKNRVTQIQIGTYQLHFKLKKFHDQKFTYTLKGGKKMIRELRYEGETYKSKYKKKVK